MSRGKTSFCTYFTKHILSEGAFNFYLFVCVCASSHRVNKVHWNELQRTEMMLTGFIKQISEIKRSSQHAWNKVANKNKDALWELSQGELMVAREQTVEERDSRGGWMKGGGARQRRTYNWRNNTNKWAFIEKNLLVIRARLRERPSSVCSSTARWCTRKELFRPTCHTAERRWAHSCQAQTSAEPDMYPNLEHSEIRQPVTVQYTRPKTQSSRGEMSRLWSVVWYVVWQCYMIATSKIQPQNGQLWEERNWFGIPSIQRVNSPIEIHLRHAYRQSQAYIL